jgi:hypothetical protein
MGRYFPPSERLLNRQLLLRLKQHQKFAFAVALCQSLDEPDSRFSDFRAANEPICLQQPKTLLRIRKNQRVRTFVHFVRIPLGRTSGETAMSQNVDDLKSLANDIAQFIVRADNSGLPTTAYILEMARLDVVAALISLADAPLENPPPCITKH